MAKNQIKMLNETVRKIPLFAGLSPSQINAVLGVCQLKRLPANTVVCASGTQATEMYILLSGELAVVTGDGTRVATLAPVTTVGEMGVLTRQERKATIETVTDCNLLMIPRMGFEMVLEADLAVQARVYRNLFTSLADKIVQDNVRLRDHLLEKAAQEERVRLFRRRAEMAVDLLVKEAGMNRDQVEARLDDQLRTGEHLRVLIVDDEEEIRGLLRQTLADYDTLEASTGEEALAALRQGGVDLLVTDIRMPGMDGYALLAEVKQEFPELPVVAISGVVSDRDAQEYEFDGFMEKPLDLQGFRQLVGEAVERGS